MRPSNVSAICCVIACWATGSAASPPSQAPGRQSCEDTRGDCEKWAGTKELRKENCKEEPSKSGCRASCKKCGHVFHNRDELDKAVQAVDSDPANATEKYGPIETWDVSRITKMRGLFRNKKNIDSNISSWNTSGVTDMSHMFEVRSDAPLYSDPPPAPRDPRSSSRVVFALPL